MTSWYNFSLILGGAAGALIGLQFVVLTLIAQSPSVRMAEAGAAFASPTIVHFSMALLLAALLGAPWESIDQPAVLWGLAGLSGTLYPIIVVRRMRRQSLYKPVLYDWTFHVIVPSVAYLLLVATAILSRAYPMFAEYAVAGSGLALLFIGIHNAWDSVSYHVFVSRPLAATANKSRRPT
jgi:hypothetical protein